ncbi:histidine utilization repressor [Mesorhizobium sp. CAU 1741]|uniref:histidine utilization repressor n=1 Tax=Mesorhizobium sp. CAU 1741 TaxID=3140366 RepID=UPI00325A60A7
MSGSGDGNSLHERILADIGARIVSGDWPPGHRIPFEHELTEQYGCSRMTVNKALTQLARAGLIDRRKRAGSFVARPRSQAAVLEIHDIRAEVEALGQPYRYQRITHGTRTATAPHDTALGFAPSAPLLALTCLHWAGEAPFCLEERLISLDAVPEARHETFESLSPGPWLLSHVPWSSAEHAIRAMVADRGAARLLAVEAGTACLVIERRTWTGDMPVTHVCLTYPGANHTVVARFTPQG